MTEARKRWEAEKATRIPSTGNKARDSWNRVKANNARGVDSEYISTFMRDSSSYFTQAQKDYSGLNWASATDAGANQQRKTTAADLQARSRKIRAYYSLNKDSMDEADYSKMLSYLDETDKLYKGVMSSFDKAAQYYGQFESQEQLDQLNRQNEKYSWITQAADYEEKSANRDFGNPTMQEYDDYYLKLYGGQRLNPETKQIEVVKAPTKETDPDEAPQIKDKLGFYKQIKEGDGTGYAGTIGTTGDAYFEIQQEAEDGAWDMLTDEEIGAYYYLMNSAGARTAEQYLKDMKVELSRRRAMERDLQTQEDYNSANWWEKAWMNIASVPANVFGGALAAIDGAVREARGEEFNPYSNAWAMTDYASRVRGMTAEELNRSGYKIPVLDFSVGDAYQAGMSMADSLLASTVGGKLGGTLLATNAGASEAKRLYEMGATEEQIRAGSIAAGLTEMICESVSIGKLIDMKDVKTVGQFFKNALIQGGVEASEEAVTELVNTLSNAVIMTDKSDWAQMVEAKGGNEGLALLEVLRQTTNAAIGGFISGAGSGGGVSAIKGIAGSAAQRADGQRINQSGATETLRQLALEMAEQNAGGMGKQLQRQAGKVSKNASAGRVGALYSTVMAADTAQIQERAKTQLVEQGFSEKKAGKIAEAMALQAAGDAMTQEQTKLMDSVAGNEAVQKIYDSVVQYEGSADQQLAQRVLAVNLKAALVQEGMSETEADALVTAVTQTAEQAQDLPTELQANNQQAAQRYEQPQSAEGKVVYGDQKVQVEGVKSAGNGQLIVQLADGAAVDASQLSFPTQGEQALYQVVGKIADSTGAANMLLKGLQKGNASASVYATAIDRAFFYGRHQIPLQQLQNESPYVRALTDQQANDAYTLGVLAGQKAAEQRQAEVQGGKKRQTSKKGQLHYEGDKGKLTARQETSLEACKVIAKALGIDVYVFESQRSEGGRRIGDNGWYDPKDGSIHIDLYAGQNGEGVMMFTLAHELVHFIKDWSPAKYRTLTEFLAEQYVKKGISIRDMVIQQQLTARENGRKLSFEQAQEEWVANSMETMLTDGSIVQKLSKLQTKDKSLAQKIREFVNQFAQRLKNAYKGISAQTKEGQIVSEMVGAAQELQDLFAEALIDAGNSYRSTEKNTTDDGGEIRLSARDESAYKEYSVKVNAIVNQAISGKGHINGKVQVMDIIPVGPKLAAMVAASSKNKIDISNRSIALNTGDVWHEYKRHTSAGTETSRDQIAFTKRQFQNAIKCMISPDVVETVYVDANNPTQKQSFVYAKKNDRGHYVVVEAVGGKQNPSIYPVMILQFSKAKWNKMMSQGKTLGEILLENDPKKLKALDIAQNKKSRVTAAQFASYEAIANTLHSPQLDDMLSQHGPAVKKNDSETERTSSRTVDGVSPRELLLNTVEGMVANSDEYRELQKYRGKIRELNATEEHLERLNAQLKQLYFAEGGRDYEMINKLEAQRREAVDELNRQDAKLISLENTKPIRDIVKRMKDAAYGQGFQKAKAHYLQRSEQREQDLRQHYQESRRNAVERHDKAQIRQQIRKDVQRLDSLLNKGNKQKNVKQELQAFAGAALRTAKGTFLNNYNEYDMVRNGITGTVSREHRQILQRCQELLAELDKVRDELSQEPGADNLHDKWDPEAALRREDREEALKKELSKNMAILREAGIFKVENELMEDSNAEQLMNELLTAYSALKDSELAHVRGVYSQVIYDQIDSVKKFLAGKAVKDMTAVELKELQKMYRLVLHTISTSNELFAQKRKGDVRKLGEEVIRQLQEPGKAMTPEILDKLKKLGWSNLKPETALELIGSDTLTEMMQGLYRGEDTYALDIDHARQFAQEQAQKYGRKNWDMDKAIPFAGTKITLGQAMSLYAYTKRQQAQGHLEGDGFTQASNVRIKETIGKLPVKLKYIMNATKTHKVSRDMYAGVADLLTPQQKKYADAMMEYLTKVMGAKGNEVSMQLYGIELFLEKEYFPIKTASEYHDEALGATSGEVKLKNTGFTNSVQEGASNPIVLDDFERIWAGHVDKMSLYHGFVLPMEDFDRVYNYHLTAERDVTDAAGEVYKTELVDTNETVKVNIENKKGKAANEYIETFMQQLNGGVRGDSTERLLGGLVKNFKKTAVLGSLSVAIQQPSAFIRAMAYLDVKDTADWRNWLGKSGKPDGKLVEEMYKYAPVALMKHIGGFDPGLSRTSQEYIFGSKNRVQSAVDNVLGFLPEKMDEWTWTYIWLCSKRQIHRQHPQLRVGSEEFCEKAGELFSKIIRDTQVYDSVLVKSQIMRSKNIFLQMATSFMNEPTTSMDMYIRSAIQAKRGKISKKNAARVYASAVGSQILCAAVAAFVYAARDDDEDETYWEKYMSAAIDKAKEGILPWYSIPFVKDIVSVFEGYDVERSDMSIVTDIYQGWKKLGSDKATPWEKTEAFAGSILNLFGIPLKNVSRDVRGIYNTVDHWINPRTTATKAGMRYAALEGLTGKKATKVEQLRDSAIKNDAKHILRVMATYDTQSSAESAFHEGVKEAYLNGDLSGEKAVEILQIYTNDDDQEAREYIQYWDFKKQYPSLELSKSAVVTWYEVKASGISLKVYTEYCEEKKGYTKKADIMRVIDILDLTSRQKDILYLEAGYAESTISEAPWR